MAFADWKIFKRKQELYRLVFRTLYGHQVLEDLASFCYLDSTTFNPDPNVTQRNEGRRQVILYLLSTLNMKVEEVGDLSNGHQRQSDGYLDYASTIPDDRS
jgi:hypothetical protein